MELHKLKIADIRGLDATSARDTVQEIRHELAKIRMDIYTAKNSQGAKVRGLRKTLARILTVRGEADAKAPKAPKPVKAPAAKAAAKAPKVEKSAKAAAKAPKKAEVKPAKAKTSKK